MGTVSLQTVTITAETLQLLAKQKEYGNLLALYIMYVEITTWQSNNSVKATTEFMAKRLKWDRHKIIRLKKVLVKLDLIRDVVKKDDKGKVLGHYILVRHVYNDESIHPAEKPQGGIHHRVESKQTSANNLNKSANDLKESTKTFTNVKEPRLDSTTSSTNSTDPETATEYGSPAINRILKVFEEHYGFLPRKNIQRFAAHRLIKKLGDDGALEVAVYAVSIAGKPYAPVITNPSDLEYKLEKLKLYRETNSQAGVIEL